MQFMIQCGKMTTARQATDHKMLSAYKKIKVWIEIHNIIFNTYCFSTVTMVT
jgi:hypothetical protein